MMSTSRIAIVGIDLISASIAYALQARDEPLEIVGFDDDRAIADLAKVRGALDDVRRKPEEACEGAELVIVAQPLADIRDTFVAIGPRLAEDAVVTDTARLKGPVLQWADEFLPEHASFVGGHVIPNPAIVGLRALEGLKDAEVDLLREALYCFIASPKTTERALDVCSWLAYAVEANPFFIDVKEHDGLLAGVEGLPDLLTIALLRTTVDSPGWKEMRKFAGRRFANATEAVEAIGARHPSLFLNRDNVLQRLDALIEELSHLRGLLAEADEEALEDVVRQAAEGRSRWIKQRRKGMWTEDGTFDRRDVPGAAKQLGQMLFGNLVSRFQRGPGESDEE